MGNVYYIEKFLNKMKEDDALDRISSDFSLVEERDEEESDIDLTNAVTSCLLNDIRTFNNKIFIQAKKDFIKEDYQTFLNPMRVIGWEFAAEYYMNELEKENKELIKLIQNKNKLHFYKKENEISLEDLSHLLYQLKKALE